MAKVIEHHVYAIWGGPMGGKSTLAVNMATVLANSGKMTCLVSANDHGELQAFYGTSISKNKGLYAAMSGGRNVREFLIEAMPNLCILEPDTGGDSLDISAITKAQVDKIIDDLSDQFNYVIVDCTNHKDSAFTGFGLAKADKVVVCIPHRVSAATWHIANRQMLNALASKTLYVDCDTREDGCDIEQLLVSIDLPECPVRIAYTPTAYLRENTSKPIVLGSNKYEKRYKKDILKILQLLLELETDEEHETKKNQQKRGLFQRREKPSQKTPAYDDDDNGTEEESINHTPISFGHVKAREGDGLTGKKMSMRQERKAEEEAMRRALKEREHGNF